MKWTAQHNVSCIVNFTCFMWQVWFFRNVVNHWYISFVIFLCTPISLSSFSLFSISNIHSSWVPPPPHPPHSMKGWVCNGGGIGGGSVLALGVFRPMSGHQAEGAWPLVCLGAPNEYMIHSTRGSHEDRIKGVLPNCSPESKKIFNQPTIQATTLGPCANVYDFYCQGGRENPSFKPVRKNTVLQQNWSFTLHVYVFTK